MPVPIDAFMIELRARPKVIAAVAEDPIWTKHINAIEVGLQVLWQLGDDDMRALDLSDRANAIMKSGAPMKQRLLSLVDVLKEASRIWGGR
jgi:hypothetical protein